MADDQELEPAGSGALKAGFIYLALLFVVIIAAVLRYIGIF
jgi:hypothetical protein